MKKDEQKKEAMNNFSTGSDPPRCSGNKTSGKRWRRRIAIGLLITAAILIAVMVMPTRPQSELMKEMTQSMAKHKQFIKKASYVILVDYDLPVFMRRLWVIEKHTGKIIINAHVSHGRRSKGFFRPKTFSNTIGSYIPIKGAFVTGERYKSNFGDWGMRIDGLEPGFNDNARTRAIVFHQYPLPVLSGGCFMTFPWINRRIIDLTRGGTFFYVHGTGPFV